MRSSSERQSASRRRASPTNDKAKEFPPGGVETPVGFRGRERASSGLLGSKGRVLDQDESQSRVKELGLFLVVEKQALELLDFEG